MRDHVRRVAGREDEQAWIQPLEIPTGQGQVGRGVGTQRRKRKGSQSQREYCKKERVVNGVNCK